MGTTYGNPFWDKPKQPPKKKEPWWENPWFYLWSTIYGFAAMVAAGYGVFLQTTFGVLCLLIITGKVRIIDMDTEFPDDPEFDYLPKDHA